MTPSTSELAAGQKAYERLDAFQRQKPVQSLLYILIVAVGSLVRASENDDRKMALGTALFWSVLGLTLFYQFQKQKKRAQESALLLADLKQTYGEKVYTAIEKSPHSIFYQLCIRRYPPFRGQPVHLP